MLKVKTYIDKSPIHGLGLFAEEEIKKGTVVWEFVEGFDFKIPSSIYYHVDDIGKIFLDTYACLVDDGDSYIVTIDNDRFTNHSDNPNVGDDDNGYHIALKDISKGEEILVNYDEFLSIHDPCNNIIKK